jgi:DNA-binding NarL/FixJ family response regulator
MKKQNHEIKTKKIRSAFLELKKKHLKKLKKTGSIAWRVMRPARRSPASLRSRTHLSTRETEVLGLLSRGLSNKEIADQMGLSVETVRSYLKTIYEKLHVHCRTEAVMRYAVNATANSTRAQEKVTTA